MSATEIARSPKHYSFVCKRGQAEQVIGILRGLGLTPLSLPARYIRGFNSDGILVYATLEGLSKRSIDRAMFEAGVPGARNG